MKRFFAAAVLALCISTTAAAKEGCSLVGSWMTMNLDTDYSQWMATINGQGHAGTGEVEVPKWPEALPPGAVAWTTLRGVWQRTGPNTFAFTLIGWLVDASGTPLYVARNSGTEILSEDCTVLTVVSTMEILTEAMEPIPGVDPVNVPVMIAQRIVVQPPAVIPEP